MLVFLVRRILSAIPVVVGVSITVFLMIHLIPGDPAELIAGIEATQEDVENVRQALDLDEPLPVQYLNFVGRALTGDFGDSFRTGRPVVQEIGFRYVNTLFLALVAIAFSLVVGIVSGIVTAVYRDGVVDNVVLVTSLIGISMPTFFLGLVLMLLFSVYLGLLPLTGAGSWQHVVLPAITLGTANAAIISRIMRSSLIETLGQDHVRTARAKGLTEFVVINRHAVRTALIPVVTIAGLQAGYLLGGAVVTETVFAWPGIGRLVVQSINARDFPVVQAAVLLLALTFVLINLLTDILYRLLDPRIEVQ